MLLLGRLNKMRFFSILLITLSIFFSSNVLAIASALAPTSAPALVSAGTFEALFGGPVTSSNLSGGTVFEGLMSQSVTSSNIISGSSAIVGDGLLGDLLSKPMVSAALTGVSLIPQVNPYVRVGSAIAGVLLNSSSGELFLKPKLGGPQPLLWTTPNNPPLSASSNTQTTYSFPNSIPTYDSNESCQSHYLPIYYWGNFVYSGGWCYWTDNGWFRLAGPTVNTVSNCPSGYSLQSGSCVLSESPSNGYVPYPSTVPSAIVPNTSGTGWTLDPRNNPTDGYSVPETSNLPNSISENIPSPNNGQPSQTTVTPNAGGGLNIQDSSQFTDTNNNPSVETTFIQTDPNGNVTSVNSLTYPGLTLPQYITQQQSGTLPLSSTLPTNQPILPPPSTTVTPNPYRTDLPNASIPPSNASPLPMMSPAPLPVTSNGSNPMPSAGSCDCTLKIYAPSAPTFLDSLQNTWNGINSLPFVNLLSFSYSPSGLCPALTYDFSNAGLFSRLGVVSTYVHCDLLNMNSSVISSFAMAAYCITAIFIFLDT